MDAKPQRPARAPIAGLGIHNENVPPPTRALATKHTDLGLVRPDARRALANVANAPLRPLAESVVSSTAAAAGPLKPKLASANSSTALHPVANSALSRPPSKPLQPRQQQQQQQQHQQPLPQQHAASGPLHHAPRPAASAPNLSLAAAKHRQALHAVPTVSRHAGRIYVDAPAPAPAPGSATTATSTAASAAPAAAAKSALRSGASSEDSGALSESAESGSQSSATSVEDAVCVAVPNPAHQTSQNGEKIAAGERSRPDAGDYWDDDAELGETDEEDIDEDDIDQADVDEDEDDDYIHIPPQQHRQPPHPHARPSARVDTAVRPEVIPEQEDEHHDQDQPALTSGAEESHSPSEDEIYAFTVQPGAHDVIYNDRVRRELIAAAEWAAETQDDELEDFCDYSMAAEYRDEIFPYMRQLEERMRPNPTYMDRQTEIEWPMRAVLVDWLVQVHFRFALLPETLFLAINIIDRFLSVKVVSVGKLQLVGATAILVAAKYEEISCPSLSDMVFMVDNGYSADEILKAERFMLSMLQFELGWPGPMSFLRRISKADDYDWETRTLAKYFLEVTIMDARFVACRPSLSAAASHCLARLLLSKGGWSIGHVYYSQYTYEQIRPYVAVLVDCCRRPRRHHGAVYEKYSHSRFSRASLFVEAEMRAGFALPPAVALSLTVPVSSPGGFGTEAGYRSEQPLSASVTPTDENAPPTSAVSTVSAKSCFSTCHPDSNFSTTSLTDRKRRR